MTKIIWLPTGNRIFISIPQGAIFWYVLIEKKDLIRNNTICECMHTEVSQYLKRPNDDLHFALLPVNLLEFLPS